MQTIKKSGKWQLSSSIKILHYRAELLANIRSFFKQKKVLEVETPILSQAATCDVFIDSFSTSQNNVTYYLHTSPEFAMKRLLASGSGDIFQLAKVFRQEELGNRHNPEFTLLEWYRLNFDDKKLMHEVADLILYLISQSSLKINTNVKVEYLSYKQCFLQKLSINPHTASILELKQCAKKYALADVLSEKDNKDRWLELLLSCVIEKELSGTILKPKMIFLYDYPASQASLARVEENNNGEQVAKRFELYFAGMELANGFYELKDAKEQLRRFEQDNVTRAHINKQQCPIDKNLIEALEFGLPTCAGVSLGIDRLLMILLGEKNIENVISFSFNHA